MTREVVTKQSMVETLLRLVDTEKVLIQQVNDGFHITPIRKESGLLGIAKDSNLTTDKFLEYKRDEKAKEDLESIRQKRLAFLGCMDGKIWMSDDFDEPLEEMKEYME